MFDNLCRRGGLDFESRGPINLGFNYILEGRTISPLKL